MGDETDLCGRLSLVLGWTALALLLAACSTPSSAPPPPATLPPASSPSAISTPLPPAAAPTLTTQMPLAAPTPPAATAAAATPGAPLSGKFEANGRQLYIECLGTGSPAIVLEPGEGGTALSMSDLRAELSRRTRVCSYDRANQGRSGSAPTPRTARDAVDDLHALLAAAQVTGPYVLVGSSAGGLLVQLYARTFPQEVSGVVAMNPVPPAHPWLDDVRSVFSPQELADEEAYYRGNNGEPFDYMTSSQQLAEAGRPPNVPFELLISTVAQCEGDDACIKSYPIYEKLMAQVAAAWPGGKLQEVEASHEIYKDRVDVVLPAINRVLGSP